MKNNLFQGSVLAALCSAATLPVTAFAANYTVYGKAEVQIANTDTGIMRYADEGTQIDAPFSRIGIKGDHTLNADESPQNKN